MEFEDIKIRLDENGKVIEAYNFAGKHRTFYVYDHTGQLVHTNAENIHVMDRQGDSIELVDEFDDIPF